MNQSRAVIQNRHHKLLDYLRNNKTLTVADASALLNVSPLTIRRDFQYLEEKNLITRFHGGASFNSSFSEHETGSDSGLMKIPTTASPLST